MFAIEKVCSRKIEKSFCLPKKSVFALERSRKKIEKKLLFAQEKLLFCPGKI